MDIANALEIATQTSPGMVRSHNEDAVLTLPAYGFVVLADGMGGHNAGEVASGKSYLGTGSAGNGNPTHEYIDISSGAKPTSVRWNGDHPCLRCVLR